MSVNNKNYVQTVDAIELTAAPMSFERWHELLERARAEGLVKGEALEALAEIFRLRAALKYALADLNDLSAGLRPESTTTKPS